MPSKAKSGMSAVRMFTENIVAPPNTYTPGAASFTTRVFDSKGMAQLHAGVANNVAGTLAVFESWLPASGFVQTYSIATAVDGGGSGLQIADIDISLSRRYAKIVFTGVLGAAFVLGAYMVPRATNRNVVGGGGGGGVPTPVKGVPGANLNDNADVAVALPLGTVAALPVVPANARRVKIQNTVAATIVRVRKVGAGAGRGLKLCYLGTAEYGGLDGALVNMEAELVEGTVNGAVMVQYERD